MTTSILRNENRKRPLRVWFSRYHRYTRLKDSVTLSNRYTSSSDIWMWIPADLIPFNHAYFTITNRHVPTFLGHTSSPAFYSSHEDLQLIHSVWKNWLVSRPKHQNHNQYIPAVFLQPTMMRPQKWECGRGQPREEMKEDSTSFRSSGSLTCMSVHLPAASTIH